MTRLAIVTTHPIQYYAPWFRHLAAGGDLDLKVFYLWDFGVTDKVDPVFGQAVRWDVPLLEGYEHEFVPNRSRRPDRSSSPHFSSPATSRWAVAFGIPVAWHNSASVIAPPLDRKASSSIAERSSIEMAGSFRRAERITTTIARYDVTVNL